MGKNYYDVLGVSKSASDDELKKGAVVLEEEGEAGGGGGWQRAGTHPQPLEAISARPPSVATPRPTCAPSPPRRRRRARALRAMTALTHRPLSRSPLTCAAYRKLAMKWHPVRRRNRRGRGCIRVRLFFFFPARPRFFLAREHSARPGASRCLTHPQPASHIPSHTSFPFFLLFPRTKMRATHRPPTSSRKSPKRTRSCPTPRKRKSTTCTGRRA